MCGKPIAEPMKKNIYFYIYDGSIILGPPANQLTLAEVMKK